MINELASQGTTDQTQTQSMTPKAVPNSVDAQSVFKTPSGQTQYRAIRGSRTKQYRSVPYSLPEFPNFSAAPSNRDAHDASGASCPKTPARARKTESTVYITPPRPKRGSIQPPDCWASVRPQYAEASLASHSGVVVTSLDSGRQEGQLPELPIPFLVSTSFEGFGDDQEEMAPLKADRAPIPHLIAGLKSLSCK